MERQGSCGHELLTDDRNRVITRDKGLHNQILEAVATELLLRCSKVRVG